MRRLLVLFTLAAGMGAVALVACGGNDKPPLTPDTLEPPAPPVESADSGALNAPAAPSAPSPGSATPPAK